MDFIAELNKAAASGKAYAAAVITASEGAAPRHAGAKMIIYDDGSIAGTIGGGEIEQKVIADAMSCLAKRTPVMNTYPVIHSDGTVSGSETIYIEPVFPRARLVLCGAGHVAGKLIHLAKSIGFHVTVIDIRDEAVIHERAAAADEFIREPSWEQGLARVPQGDDCYMIACSFNFEQDEEILYHLVRRRSAYIGMLASRFKVQTIYNHLKERGISADLLDPVHAPIGLPIGAETPEEIALSIAAELVKERSTAEKAKASE